jgi:hypothetical protein
VTSVQPTTWVEVETGMYLLDPNGTPWYVDAKTFMPGQGWLLVLLRDPRDHSAGRMDVTRPADAPTNILVPSLEQARDMIARVLGGTVIHDEGGTP